MTTWHVHLWGVKGRLPHRPRHGDLCLSCPQEWAPGVSGYLVDGYKPRIVPHVPTARTEEAA